MNAAACPNRFHVTLSRADGEGSPDTTIMFVRFAPRHDEVILRSFAVCAAQDDVPTSTA